MKNIINIILNIMYKNTTATKTKDHKKTRITTIEKYEKKTKEYNEKCITRHKTNP